MRIATASVLRALTLLVVGACGRIAFDPPGSRGDASSDAADRFCAHAPAAAYFCSDFDEDTDGFAAWSTSIVDFGRVDLDTTDMTSKPRSMLVTTDLAAADTHAFEESGPLGIVPRPKLSFDVRLADGNVSQPVMAAFFFDDGTTQHEIEYVYQRPPAASYIEEYVMPQPQLFKSYPLAAQTQPNLEWQRITFEVQTGATPRVVTTLDGALTLDTALTGTTGGTLLIRVGVVYVSSGAAPWRIGFDNVLVE